MKEILYVTRKALDLVSQAHLAALRTQVRAVRAKATAERVAARAAWNTVEKARTIAHQATLLANAADDNAAHVEQAARVEAAQIGATL